MLGKVWLHTHKKIITNENHLKEIQGSYILKSKAVPKIINNNTYMVKGNIFN